MFGVVVHRVDTTRRAWTEPSADDVERELSRLVAEMLRESVKLGRSAPGSKQHAAHKAAVANHWMRFRPTVAQLKAITTREAKRSTRDALHARLCEIQKQADRNPAHVAKPYIAWKQAIDGV